MEDEKYIVLIFYCVCLLKTKVMKKSVKKKKSHGNKKKNKNGDVDMRN